MEIFEQFRKHLASQQVPFFWFRFSDLGFQKNPCFHPRDAIASFFFFYKNFPLFSPSGSSNTHHQKMESNVPFLMTIFFFLECPTIE